MLSEVATKPIPLRLDTDVIERIDAFIERAKKQNFGVPMTRTAVIRTLILKGLDEIEGKAPQKKK